MWLYVHMVTTYGWPSNVANIPPLLHSLKQLLFQIAANTGLFTSFSSSCIISPHKIMLAGSPGVATLSLDQSKIYGLKHPHSSGIKTDEQ